MREPLPVIDYKIARKIIDGNAEELVADYTEMFERIRAQRLKV